MEKVRREVAEGEPAATTTTASELKLYCVLIKTLSGIIKDAMVESVFVRLSIDGNEILPWFLSVFRLKGNVYLNGA
jgi:hypothetical protein